MRIFPLFLTGLGLCLSSPVAADLDFTVEGRPYRLVTTAKTWEAAEADAQALGGQLVHIDSELENEAVRTAIQSVVPAESTATDGDGAKYVWIGGKETEEGSYAWSDAGSSLFWAGGGTGAPAGGAFAKWGSAEPNNLGDSQNRAAMALTSWPASGPPTGQAGQWNDINSTNSLAYVVEMSGIYVSVNMSLGGVNKGTFCSKLYFEKAPLAVANFVSLAEGRRPFVDEKSGRVAARPFYNGLTWHRIITGFMCQGGDPAGNGTGGPGYTFLDQFDASLRHTRPGLMSLANSGPNTNGSQFFITVAPTTWLDDVHTIFGEVVSGYNTVVLPMSIRDVAGNPPPSPVVMETVTIHRAGTAARAFNAMTPNIPIVREVQGVARLSPTGGHCLIDWPGSANCSYSLLATANFTAWKNLPNRVILSAQGAGPQTLDTFPLVSQIGTPPRSFFKIAEASYTNVPPPSIQGQIVTLTATNGLTFVCKLSAATTGTWNIISPALTGPIHDYFWQRSPLQAVLQCAISGLSFGPAPGILANQVDVRLVYNGGNTGTGDITFLTRSPLNTLSTITKWSGTFTTTPLP